MDRTLTLPPKYSIKHLLSKLGCGKEISRTRFCTHFFNVFFIHQGNAIRPATRAWKDILDLHLRPYLH